MLGGREMLLEVMGAAPVDAAPEVDDEDPSPVVLWGPGAPSGEEAALLMLGPAPAQCEFH